VVFVRIELLPIKTQLIKEDDDLVEILLHSVSLNGQTIRDGDIIVIASTVISLTEKRKKAINEVKISEKAKQLAELHKTDPVLIQLIIDENAEIIGGPPGFLLTIWHGIPCINACIDATNAPLGCYMLPPKDPMASAHRIKEEIKSVVGKDVAIIIADSGVVPGKRGTIGIAIGFAGIKPIKNYIGKKDLYGNVFRVTQQNIIDLVASSAELLMGEADERIPFVIVRFEDTNIEFTQNVHLEDMLFPLDKCIFMSNILTKKRK